MKFNNKMEIDQMSSNKKIMTIGLIILCLSVVLFISSPSASNHDENNSTTYLSNGNVYNISAKPYINGNIGHIIITAKTTEDVTKTFLINGRKISLNGNKTSELNTTDFEIPSDGVSRILEISEENGDKVATLNVEFESNGTNQGNSTVIQSASTVSNVFSNKDISTFSTWLPNDENIMLEWLAQVREYTCGPHAIVKSIYDFVGHEYSEMSIATNYGYVIGDDGTNHEQLENIYRSAGWNAGFDMRFNWYTFSEIGGWNGIRDAVSDPNKNVIIHNLYKNTWGHYEFILNVNTDSQKIKLDNSLPSTTNQWGGSIEDRDFATMKQYMDGISQKSVLVVTHHYN
jgi:hypothetical protein